MMFCGFPRCRLSNHRGGLVLPLALMLAGCATLPSSGPTGAQITKAARSPQPGTDFTIVELTDIASVPAVAKAAPVLPVAEEAVPADIIGVGDVLDISIYEMGVGLFGPGARSNAQGESVEPGSQMERLPPIRVDDAGNIQLPYVGRLRAAGRSVADFQATIRDSLLGMSQSPQVLVSIREAIRNSVIVGGEVAKPGRLVLPTARETLSDAIALAGGYRGDAKDLTVRLRRQETDFDIRLSDVLGGLGENVAVRAGDRITILRAPRSFSVMGAPGRVEQISFASPAPSLAEAVATAGGANPNLGDPAAIFVFRFVMEPDGVERPVVYHLNMMKAGSYFISQRFAMLDKDVLYFGNARANQPSKLIQIISQLFAPIVTVRDIARTTN